MDPEDYEPEDYDDEYCNCSACRDDYDEDTEIDGEPRGFCTACKTAELHFLEDEEIYVCDCTARVLLDNNPEFPIKLHHSLPELTHV